MKNLITVLHKLKLKMIMGMLVTLLPVGFASAYERNWNPRFAEGDQVILTQDLNFGPNTALKGAAATVKQVLVNADAYWVEFSKRDFGGTKLVPASLLRSANSSDELAEGNNKLAIGHHYTEDELLETDLYGNCMNTFFSANINLTITSILPGNNGPRLKEYGPYASEAQAHAAFEQHERQVAAIHRREFEQAPAVDEDGIRKHDVSKAFVFSANIFSRRDGYYFTIRTMPNSAGREEICTGIAKDQMRQLKRPK